MGRLYTVEPNREIESFTQASWRMPQRRTCSLNERLSDPD
jgi:hypothetical protein